MHILRCQLFIGLIRSQLASLKPLSLEILKHEEKTIKNEDKHIYLLYALRLIFYFCWLFAYDNAIVRTYEDKRNI